MRVVLTSVTFPESARPRAGVQLLDLRYELERWPHPNKLETLGEEILGVRNAPPVVKAAVGLAVEARADTFIAGSSGDLTDLRAAMTSLETRLETLVLPVFPDDPERTRKWAPSWLEEIFVNFPWSQRSTRSEARGPSRFGFEDNAVAVVGTPTATGSLLTAINLVGLEVVYHEWSVWRQAVAQCPDIWAGLCLPGLDAPIRDRHRRLVDVCGSHIPIICCIEPFCGRSFDDMMFRMIHDGPVMTMDISCFGELSHAQRLRLDSFAEQIMRKRGNNGQ